MTATVQKIKDYLGPNWKSIGIGFSILIGLLLFSVLTCSKSGSGNIGNVQVMPQHKPNIILALFLLLIMIAGGYVAYRKLYLKKNVDITIGKLHIKF